MQKPKEKEENPRRDFMKLGALSAAAVCGSMLCSCGFGEGSGKNEKVKLLTPDGEIVEVDRKHIKPVHTTVNASVEEARKGIPGRKFVMVIDLSRCKNLRKCHDACDSMHQLSHDKEFLKILKMQANDMSAPYWEPTMCFHCDHPPCVKVCPVDATFKRSDGIVLIDTERCIGCRFCMVACPYSARVFDWSEPDILQTVKNKSYSPETSVPPKKGTVSKCDFCPDMVRMGDMPHCVTACPNGVFYFGDEYEDAVSNGDETVGLKQLLNDRGGYRLMEDFGTKPRVYYLPPVNRLFPFEDDEFTKPNSEG
jgi:Fe-S-cluster-containing dehydrogenase component